MFALAGAVWANQRLRVPEDVTPPFYTSGSGPFFLEDGSLFAINDGEWAAIVFYRSPDFAPAGFDFLNDFDPNVFDAPLHVDGFIQLDQDGNFLMSQTQARERSRSGSSSGMISRTPRPTAPCSIDELLAMDSLKIGTATSFEERESRRRHSPGQPPDRRRKRDAGGRRHVRPARRRGRAGVQGSPDPLRGIAAEPHAQRCKDVRDSCVPGRLLLRAAAPRQATTSFTTLPYTSVRRKSRPA